MRLGTPRYTGAQMLDQGVLTVFMDVQDPIQGNRPPLLSEYLDLIDLSQPLVSQSRLPVDYRISK